MGFCDCDGCRNKRARVYHLGPTPFFETERVMGGLREDLGALEYAKESGPMDFLLELERFSRRVIRETERLRAANGIEPDDLRPALAASLKGGTYE